MFVVFVYFISLFVCSFCYLVYFLFSFCVLLVKHLVLLCLKGADINTIYLLTYLLVRDE